MVAGMMGGSSRGCRLNRPPSRTGPGTHLASASLRLKAAKAAVRAGKPQRALELLEPLQFSLAVAVIRATAWERLERRDEARHSWAEAVASAPLDPSLVFRLADCLHRMGHASEVLDLVRRTPEQAKSVKLWRLYGQAAKQELLLGGPLQALRGEAHCGDDPDVIRRLVGVLMRQRLYEEAYSTLDGLTELEDRDQLNLFECALKSGLEVSEEWLKRGVGEDPGRAVELAVAAGRFEFALQLEREFSDSRRWSEELLRWRGQQTPHVEVKSRRSETIDLLQQRQWGKLVTLLSHVERTDEESIVLGEALRNLGDLRRAKEVLEGARSVGADFNLGGYLNRILVELALHPGEVQSAVEQEVVEDLSPLGLEGPTAKRLEEGLSALRGNRTQLATWWDGRRLRRLAGVSCTRHRTSQLTALLHAWPFEAVVEHAATLGPGWHPLVYTHRAEIQLWRGSYREALGDCERALELDPQTRWAWLGKALCHMLLGQPDDCRNALGESRARLSHLPNIEVVAGELALREQRFEDAIEGYGVALAAHPSRLSARVGLELALIRGGHPSSEQELRELIPTFWRHATLALDRQAESTSPESVLSQMLQMMRGNRGSSVLTYFKPSGSAHYVPKTWHLGAQNPAPGSTVTVPGPELER